MANFFEDWVNESDENQKLYAQEELILEVTEEIWRELELRQWKKSDLAKSLGKSNAYITQVLSGSRNMTLRTLSDIAFALNLKPKLNLLQKDEEWSWYQLGDIRSGGLPDVINEQDSKWSQPAQIHKLKEIHTKVA